MIFFFVILLAHAALLGVIRDEGQQRSGDLRADLKSSHFGGAHVCFNPGPAAER